MKVVWVGLGLCVALALQTTLVRMVADSGAAVDLVLVVVVLVAISGGPVAGLWTGTVGGLLQDALSGGVVGVGGLSKTLVGYLVGQFASQFVVTQVWHQLIVFFLAALLHAGCFVVVYRLLSDEGIMSSYGGVLTQAMTSAVVGVAVTLAFEMAPGVITRRRLRRRALSRRFGA
jgi:rod shape-determining protein MreD